MHKILLAIVATATLPSVSVGAETLADAWAMALQNDHSLGAVRLDTQAARAETAAARAQRWPSLSGTGSYVQFSDAPAFDFSAAGLPVEFPEVVDDDDALLGSVTLSVPLFTGGRISSSIAAAGAQQAAREANEAQATQDLKLAVVHAYVDVLRARRALAVADSNVAMLEAYASEVRSMFDREVVPRNDLLAAQVALANAIQGRIRTANAVSLALAAYNRRLGEPLTREASLEPELPALALAHDAPIEQLIERALTNRRELAALASQAEAVGHQAKAERAKLYPQLVLSGSYQYLENEVLDREEFAMAGIGFNWAVFDGGVTRHRAAALRRVQHAVEERRNELESLIALEVRQHWLDAQEARSRLRVTADAVAQAEENLRITRQQYLAGLVISTRVLEAESLRVQSHTNHDNAVLDAGAAQYRLARAVGEL